MACKTAIDYLTVYSSVSKHYKACALCMCPMTDRQTDIRYPHQNLHMWKSMTMNLKNYCGLYYCFTEWGWSCQSHRCSEVNAHHKCTSNSPYQSSCIFSRPMMIFF